MKRVAMFLLVLTIFLSGVPFAQASNSINGIQLFPEDHILNVPINTLPVDPKSSLYINNNGGASGNLFAAWGTGNSGLGYDTAGETLAKSKVAFRYYSTSDNVLYPIPPNPQIEGSATVAACTGDCHVLIVNKDTKKLYEIFDLGPKLSNGSYTAGSGAVWDLTSYSLRPKGWAAADAAGLPMLPLMIRYDEILAGEINHAIRITVPHTQNTYIWPARAQAGAANTAYPPMGQRFRLKESYDISGFSPTNQIILKAMKKYGMILTDNGWDKDSRKWWIYGVRDARWNTGDLWDLTSVKGTDFEAVDVSSLMIDSNSGKARVSSISTSGTTTPSITVTSPNGGETWTAGTSKTITWSYTGSPGSTVKVEFLKGSVPITIGDSVPVGSGGKGSYTYSIWSGRTPGADYKVRIQSTSQPAIQDVSNNYFTISSGTGTSGTTNPSITVTSPNGGESWARGTSKIITWSYTGNPGSTVKVEFLKGGTPFYAENVPIGSGGKGSYTWSIWSGRPTGSDYKVSIQSTSQTTIKDMSNNYFSITS
jgi:hypothetical protein